MFAQAWSFEEWRDRARPWLLAGVTPGSACRAIDDGSPPPPAPGTVPDLKLPAALMRLLDSISCFRADGRHELMYRLAWRTLYEQPRLLEDAADADVRRALLMDASIRRDVHKMHAFVRFREVLHEHGEPRYFAWFEPEHDILRRAVPFFVKRFRNMPWTIATPAGAAVWDQTTVAYLASPQRAAGPSGDAHEDLWRTYYRSICNVARINVPAMQREMPQKYWRNLPETREIAGLLRDARLDGTERTQQAQTRRRAGATTAAPRAHAESSATRENPQDCRRCDLWRHATQAVLGRGPKPARIMLVGEQPGDIEDLQGLPFVGPAGRVLDAALAAAGLTRAELFITNAVKHFKWEPRGKRRLHKKPEQREVNACHVWLEREIAAVAPRVIVALGATALRALTGSSLAIEAARREILAHESGAKLLATYHPSAILRAEGERAVALRSALVEDLVRAATLAS